MNRSIATLTVIDVPAFGADDVGADEGRVSSWLPDQNASLTAVPGPPGWSASAAYYFYDESFSVRNKRLNMVRSGSVSMPMAA